MRTDLDNIVNQLRMSMNSDAPKLGYAVIGTGMMGREHIRAVHQLNQARIVGVFDTNTQSVEKALKAFTGTEHEPPKVYKTIAEINQDAEVDAVLICTPNFTHREIFDAVKISGKAVLLEKPMATTLEDAFYLATASLSYPAPIQLGMQYRYKSQYQLALNSLAKGELGDVKMVSLSEYRPPFLPKVDEWNKFSRYSGGTLVEKCCHYFDLMNRIANCQPVRVYASGGKAVNFKDFTFDGQTADIDDHALVIVDYENGVKGQFTLNMFSEELYETLVVSGDKGTLRAEEEASFKSRRSSMSKIKVEVKGHDAYDGIDCTFPQDIELGGHYGSTLFEHDRFSARVNGTLGDGASCPEGLWAIITAWMAQESMKTGQVVDVRSTLEQLRINPYQQDLLPTQRISE